MGVAVEVGPEEGQGVYALTPVGWNPVGPGRVVGVFVPGGRIWSEEVEIVSIKDLRMLHLTPVEIE